MKKKKVVTNSGSVCAHWELPTDPQPATVGASGMPATVTNAMELLRLFQNDNLEPYDLLVDPWYPEIWGFGEKEIRGFLSRSFAELPGT